MTKPRPFNPDGTLSNFDPDGDLLRPGMKGERMCYQCAHNLWTAWCSFNGGRFKRFAHPGNYAGNCKRFQEVPRG